MIGIFLSDQGKVRNHNEDAGGIFHHEKNQVLAVVADGMGGHKAGDVASQLAVSTLHKKWNETSYILQPGEAEKWMRNAITEVNREILHHSRENEECRGMGTTVVAALCNNQFTTIGHIGDSRVYLANGDGFVRITEDHSLVNELVRSGQISEEQAETHPRKNVLLKALGTDENVSPDIRTLEFEEGDRLLLCSDGLTNKVQEHELSRLSEYNGNWQDFCQSFINLANERGGEDNITMAVVQNSDTSLKEGVDCDE
ncbi:Stp1/IreP family PP2C-type Ser/Thr phosphatase [Halobacillus sp. A5]|uniref:Stp1/IreP family PP2C-type Ser/Thr phosphatase n=1 Tax=Halobacillus sp. A5 TaxID=2880263 RepID=UPI0020A66B47|nr:Stp1/IreP family PP2C-type Ser/Thr phosphatase [Halobacillus sp. A5]MCP3026171.1 Stp1/IreP family PP2C-type Ser/Thr phosphatase [Halobacillus sp. A5]